MADTGITVGALRTELAAVRTAILNILTTGASYSRAGLNVAHESLTALQDREKYLIRSIMRSDEGLMTVSDVSHGSQIASWNNGDEDEDVN